MVVALSFERLLFLFALWAEPEIDRRVFRVNWWLKAVAMKSVQTTFAIATEQSANVATSTTFFSMMAVSVLWKC